VKSGRSCLHVEMYTASDMRIEGIAQICAQSRQRFISDYADLLDAVVLLKRWTRKYPDTDLGLKTVDWLKRRDFKSSILR